MIERFGGVDGFANEWTRQYNESPEGSRTRQNYLFGIVKLLEVECNRSPARLIWAMRADCRI